jgi:hypothetical protein
VASSASPGGVPSEAKRHPVTVGSLAPIALALLVMLPRLASPQFGLLDDGLMLQTGQEVIGRWSSAFHLIPETGRFFPAYWLVYSAIFGVVGVRPLAFFTVNALLFAVLLLILAHLVRMSGGTRLQVAIAVVLFALCGPAIETFYTLSKAEALQMMWIGLSLLATAAAASAVRRARHAGLIALAAIALLLAHTTKETSFVLIPVSVGWLAIEWWSPRQPRVNTRFAITFVTITLVAAAAFIALRWYCAPLGFTQGTYTRAYAPDPGTAAAALFRISAWLIRDFAFLVPLVAVAAFWLVPSAPASRRPILYTCTWMTGWLAVYLPWPATFEYYLLPFAFGAAALAGIVVGYCWTFREAAHSTAKRLVAWSVLVASGLLWLASTVNAVADARVQLTVDRANAAVVDFLARLPTGSGVVVNTTLNEYVIELPLHLSEVKRRPDLVVEHVAGPTLAEPVPAQLFVVTPHMANRPAPTVRIPLDETAVRHDHTILTALPAGRSELVYRAEEYTRLIEFGLHRLLCHMVVSRRLDAGYCPNDRALIEYRPFLYGWEVHRLGSPGVDRAEVRHDD